MTSSFARTLGAISFYAGFLSIIASIGIWFFYKTADTAHAERFGIFVGLWAPTFLTLSLHLGKRWEITK